MGRTKLSKYAARRPKKRRRTTIAASDEPVFFCTVPSMGRLCVMSMSMATIVTWRSVSGIAPSAAIPE